MKYASVKQKEKDISGFVIDINQNKNGTNIEDFYKIEEQLLHYLFILEKEKAKQTIKNLIELVKDYSHSGQEFINVKNYFIAFSGTLARRMHEVHISTEKAFTFNLTCNMLIDEKMTHDNIVNLANELIEFTIYCIEEKSTPSLLHQTVNQVMNYIDEEVKSSLSVEGLAQMFDVSTSHLSRIFREHSGITLVEYINIKKVEESQYYLRFSDEKISDISDDFNFCNQSYYTRIFKKYTGYTPRKFRNNITGTYFRFTLPKEK